MVFLSSSGRKECKMEKTIEKFLVAHGYKTETTTQRTSAREIRGMSTEHYGDWFNQKVLGLDSEEYRRAFWHEVSTTGHTIGHVPRTLKTLLRDHHVARGSETCGVLLALAIVQGGIYPFWFISRYLSRRITRMRRSGYYARERERRYRLAAVPSVFGEPPIHVLLSTRFEKPGQSSKRPRNVGADRHIIMHWQFCAWAPSSKTLNAMSITTHSSRAVFPESGGGHRGSRDSSQTRRRISSNTTNPSCAARPLPKGSVKHVAGSTPFPSMPFSRSPAPYSRIIKMPRKTG